MIVVVRRSAMRMWLLAMAGIPLLVISLDVLTNRRLTNRLRDILFRPEDTQIFEPRDVIWSWVILIVSALMVLWGLKELFVPTKVLECRPEGLVLRLSGPFRPATVVPWESIVDVDGIEMNDESTKVPMFWLEVTDRSVLPENPWGARWVGPNAIGITAQDWTEKPKAVAEKVADYAVEEARQGRRRAVAGIWQEEE